jgi:hypothetical protein
VLPVVYTILSAVDSNEKVPIREYMQGRYCDLNAYLNIILFDGKRGVATILPTQRG